MPASCHDRFHHILTSSFLTDSTHLALSLVDHRNKADMKARMVCSEQQRVQILWCVTQSSWERTHWTNPATEPHTERSSVHIIVCPGWFYSSNLYIANRLCYYSRKTATPMIPCYLCLCVFITQRPLVAENTRTNESWYKVFDCQMRLGNIKCTFELFSTVESDHLPDNLCLDNRHTFFSFPEFHWMEIWQMLGFFLGSVAWMYFAQFCCWTACEAERRPNEGKREKMEDGTVKAELQGKKCNGKRRRWKGWGEVMKSSGPVVEEARAPASQHSLTLYRWRHAGIRSAHFHNSARSSNLSVCDKDVVIKTADSFSCRLHTESLHRRDR